MDIVATAVRKERAFMTTSTISRACREAVRQSDAACQQFSRGEGSLLRKSGKK